MHVNEAAVALRAILFNLSCQVINDRLIVFSSCEIYVLITSQIELLYIILIPFTGKKINRGAMGHSVPEYTVYVMVTFSSSVIIISKFSCHFRFFLPHHQQLVSSVR